MASKYVSRKSTLQRGETEAVPQIAVQEELNQPVTQATDAVVENDRIGSRRRACGDFFSCYAYTRRRTGMSALHAGRKSATIDRFAFHLGYVFFDFRFFQQIDARPLLASDGAAKFGDGETGI